jgi:hypothetical protein
MSPRARATAALLLFGLGGCQTVTLGARNTVNPVLIGPVRRIGGQRSGAGLENAGAFATAATSSSMASGGGGSASSFHTRSAATQTDWDVLVATNGNTDREVHLESIRCGGWAFFFLFMSMSSSSCQASGQLYRVPPSAKASAPTVASEVPAAVIPTTPSPAAVPAAALEFPADLPVPAPAAAQPGRPVAPPSNWVPPPPPPILR